MPPPNNTNDDDSRSLSELARDLFVIGSSDEETDDNVEEATIDPVFEPPGMGREYSGSFEMEVEEDDLVRDIIESSTLDDISISFDAEGPQLHEQRLNRGKLLRFMPDHNSLGEWAFDYLANEQSISAVIEAAGGVHTDEGYMGELALLETVARQTSEQIGEKIDDGNDPFESFNRATEDFPHAVKALTAAFEALEGRDHDRYAKETVQYSKSTGFLVGDDVSPPPTTDVPDDQWPNNPLDADGIGESRGEVITRARIRGLDISGVNLDDIENPNEFFEWAERSGDMEEALRAQFFPEETPSAVIRNSTDPREWDELDPHDIEKGRCTVCSESLFHVETEDGTTWATGSGRSGDVADITEGGSEYVHVGFLDGAIGDEPENKFLCAGCQADHFASESEYNSVTLVIDSDGNRALFGHNFRVMIDYSVEYDMENLVGVTEIGEDVHRPLQQQVLDGGQVDDYFYVEPGDGPETPREVAEDRISSLIYGEYEDGEFDGIGGPMIVVYYPRSDQYRLYFPRTSSEAASQAKHIIEPQLTEANV